MLPHVFAHDGILYEVSFGRIAGQWLAAAGQLSDGSKRLLPAFAEADCAFSEAAIRAGYAGVAEWLVRTGRWHECSSAKHEDAIRSRLLHAKSTEVGRSTCASVNRQDISGHALHGM